MKITDWEIDNLDTDFILYKVLNEKIEETRYFMKGGFSKNVSDELLMRYETLVEILDILTTLQNRKVGINA